MTPFDLRKFGSEVSTTRYRVVVITSLPNRTTTASAIRSRLRFLGLLSRNE
jgi:hypothetical protein